VPLSALARRYGALLLDLDGCVWVGHEPTPGAAAALAEWRASGGHVAFVTNDPRSSPEDYVRRLWAAGIRASVREVVTVGTAIARHLAEGRPGRTALVLGTPALARQVAGAGCRVVNGTPAAARAQVVVLTAHEGLGYPELRAATQAALAGADLVTAGRDRTFPMPDGPWPGSGVVAAAVEYASGRRAIAVGKPDPGIFRAALERIPPVPALVVGDRLDADVAGAAGAGLQAALVLSGASRPADVDAWTGAPPVAVAPTLADLITGG
jgi:HAD superfamily hydrolase (TIGR01450 family)